MRLVVGFSMIVYATAIIELDQVSDFIDDILTQAKEQDGEIFDYVVWPQYHPPCSLGLGSVTHAFVDIGVKFE